MTFEGWDDCNKNIVIRTFGLGDKHKTITHHQVQTLEEFRDFEVKLQDNAERSEFAKLFSYLGAKMANKQLFLHRTACSIQLFDPCIV